METRPVGRQLEFGDPLAVGQPVAQRLGLRKFIGQPVLGAQFPGTVVAGSRSSTAALLAAAHLARLPDACRLAAAHLTLLAAAHLTLLAAAPLALLAAAPQALLAAADLLAAAHLTLLAAATHLAALLTTAHLALLAAPLLSIL
jgi:hypothetical protein